MIMSVRTTKFRVLLETLEINFVHIGKWATQHGLGGLRFKHTRHNDYN